jgi:ATP-dependent protease HslVU (ClpYQ) peptidase subunit
VTTIAFAEGVMAADSQATVGDCISRVVKLYRLPCGGVVGGCGVFAELMRGVEYMLGGCQGKAPKLRETWLLVATAEGVYTVMDKEWTRQPCLGPVAVGSGMQAAQAAMVHFGVSAEEAVLAAASVDPSTSGPVQTMRVEARARPKKKKQGK